MTTRPTVDISVVCTVLNEAGTIGDLLRSLAVQTVRPREIIIVDGGSRDGTQLHVEWWHGRLGCPLRLIDAPRANISAGRNRGIVAARAPIVAVTDGGVTLAPTWLSSLATPFAHADIAVVSGFFVPDARTAFEAAMGATVLPAVRDVRPDRFLPSSRSVAFRTAAWAAVGGYPEWLDYCEDLVFDLALRDRGYRFVFVPEAVAHFRPRSSLRAFWHQYFRYARGDGKAGLWAKRHALRYATYGVALGLALAGGRGRRLWPLAVLGAVDYVRRPYQRLLPLLHRRPWRERCAAFAFVPLIRVTGDCAKMIGYPVGLAWRWRRKGLPRAAN